VVLTPQKETEKKNNAGLKHIHSFHARLLRDTLYRGSIVIVLKLEVFEAVTHHTVLQTELESSSEMLITTYESTQCHSPEENNLDRSYSTSEYGLRLTYFHLVNLIHSFHKIGNKPVKMGRYIILQLCYKLNSSPVLLQSYRIRKQGRGKSADIVNV
jgi:hypothetical protein